MNVAELESQREIKEICLRLLTRREHSQQELVNKLEIRGFNSLESELVVKALAEQGWQSNKRFAESYARFRIKKGYGPIKIIYELQQRGIRDVDLDAIVLELADGWEDIIGSVYLKKYSDDKSISHKTWVKRCRFLQQRGFSSEMIKALFKRLDIQLNYS